MINLASSSVVQKNKNAVSKKKIDSLKDPINNKPKNSSVMRNDSASRKRPPLKPNLKGNKPTPKLDKQKPAKLESKRKSVINTNPFKPPKPTVNSKDVAKVNNKVDSESVAETTHKDLDDEIQSDYGVTEDSSDQISSDQTLETSNQNIEHKEERKEYVDEQSDSGEDEEDTDGGDPSGQETNEQSQTKTQVEKVGVLTSDDNLYEPKIKKNVEFKLEVDNDMVLDSDQNNLTTKDEEKIKDTTHSEHKDINTVKVVKDQSKSEIQNILDNSGDESEGEEDNEQKIDQSIEQKQLDHSINEKKDNDVIDRQKAKYKNQVMNRLEDMMTQQKEEIEDDFDEPLPKSQNELKAEELSDQLDDIMNRPQIEMPIITPSKNREDMKNLKPINLDFKDSSYVKQQLSERTQNSEQTSEGDQSSTSKYNKPPVPKQPVKKKKKIKKQKEEEYDPDIVDYSHIYSSFYDIFNSYIQHPKTFDPSSTLREVRNLYSTYLSLMDSNILFAMPQFKFEAPPLEK
jgi:hypothetical protein